MPPLKLMSKLSVSGRDHVMCGAMATSVRLSPEVEPVTVFGRLKNTGSGIVADVVAELSPIKPHVMYYLARP